MTPEGRNENYLRKRVKEERGQIRKLRWLGRRFAPDDFIWWPGPRAAFVEVKRPGGACTRGQLREHERLRADGWAVYVVDNFETIDAVIKKVKLGG